MKDVVLELLKKHSVKTRGPNEEPFKLASGGTSWFYCDVKKTALRGDAQFQLAWLIYDELAKGDFGGINAVAGVVLGGCHLASIVAMYASMSGGTRLDVIYVRKAPKDHGTGNLVEAPDGSSQHIQKVVLVEDVITTGKSSIRAAEILRAKGYDVRGVLAIIDRRASACRNPLLPWLPVRSLFTMDDFAIKGL